MNKLPLGYTSVNLSYAVYRSGVMAVSTSSLSLAGLATFMCIYMAGMIIFYMVVTQNLVFTIDDELTAADIPFYDSSGQSGHASLTEMNRWWWESVVVSLYAIRIIPLVSPLILRMQAGQSTEGTSLIGYWIVLGFVIIWELVAIVYWSWVLAACGKYNICVNYDQEDGTDTSANYIFVWMYIMNWIFFVFDIVLCFLGEPIVRAGMAAATKNMAAAGEAKQKLLEKRSKLQMLLKQQQQRTK